MTILLTLIALALAFLCGSLPTAYLMGRAKGIDIRQHGSGNVGATNVFRVLGTKWGIACLAIDLLKGWAPTRWLPREFFVSAFFSLDGWQWALGLAAIAGHMFSPFLRFKGGKGVATSLGVILAIAPLPMLIVFTLGIVLIALFGYVSLASIVGAALLPFLILILGTPTVGPGRAWTSFGITALLGAIIIFKHRANIQRLRAGTEKRIVKSLIAPRRR